MGMPVGLLGSLFGKHLGPLCSRHLLERPPCLRLSVGRPTTPGVDDGPKPRNSPSPKFLVYPRVTCAPRPWGFGTFRPLLFFFLSHRWVTADKGTCSESASVTSLPELAGAVVICWTAGLKRTGPACCCRNKCDDHTCVLLCNKSFDVNKNAFVIHPFVVLLWGLIFGNASWCLFFF